MRYISFNELNYLFNKAHTEAEKKAIRQQRSILYIATCGGEKTRTSEGNFKKAKKCYSMLKKLNYYNDVIFTLENERGGTSGYLYKDATTKANALETQLKALLKAFKLSLVYDSFLCNMVKPNGVRLYF